MHGTDFYYCKPVFVLCNQTDGSLWDADVVEKHVSSTHLSYHDGWLQESRVADLQAGDHELKVFVIEIIFS